MHVLSLSFNLASIRSKSYVVNPIKEVNSSSKKTTYSNNYSIKRKNHDTIKLIYAQYLCTKFQYAMQLSLAYVFHFH